MQQTDLETSLAPIHAMNKKSNFRLVIGNKNYSSWSMRPWLVMKAFGIPFEEIYVPLYQSQSTQKISEYSVSGRVPVLLADELVVWDSLAIYGAQYLRRNALRFESIARCHAYEYPRFFSG